VVLMNGGGAEPSTLLNDLDYWYKLDDMADASGNGNTLTNNGDTPATISAGKIGNGVALAAASHQYLSIASNANVAAGIGDFTVGAWVKKTAAGDMFILGKWNHAGGNQKEYSLFITSSRFPRFSVSSTGANDINVINTTAMDLDVWFYILGWFDVTLGKAYVQVNDGVPVAADVASVFNGTSQLNIGQTAGFFYFTGIIDEAPKWSRKLTAAERSALYNNGVGVSYPPLVINWRRLIFDGDSLTSGFPEDAENSYPAQLAALLTGDTRYDNFGVSGQTIVEMAADAATQADPYYSGDGSYSQEVVLVWGGVNDIHDAIDSAETIHANIAAYHAARQTAGWKTVAFTIANAAHADKPVSFDATQAAVNVLIRANWESYADALCDVQADARLSNPLDTTYFSADKLHLNSAGYGVVAELAASALVGL
jgi:lysophospholipase L1-like esterase